VSESDGLIPKHGGYRKLKSFQLAQLVYDLTVRFCDLYIEKRSRTHDQMVQAARSGTQNIAEGSQASGTSKKMEMKLTNVARASMEELRLDYEDFLRQHGLEAWAAEHPSLKRFKARRCATLDEVRTWVREERKLLNSGGKDGRTTETTGERTTETTDEHGRARTGTDAGAEAGPETEQDPSESVAVGGRPCRRVSSEQLAANAALSLLNVCCHLLDRQLAAQAGAFEREGGFTERLYGRRQAARRKG
jgi:four helix bundle suffix protein